MTKMNLLICLLFALIYGTNGSRTCGKYGEYNKLDTMHRLLVCLITDICDESMSSNPEQLIKITKQLATKSGKSAREFRECGWAQIRQNFPIDYQLALNKSQLFTSPITATCMSQKEVCRVHKEFLYPVVCLLETKCDQELAKLTYAFLYAVGQLNVETEGPLRCEENGEFDVDVETIFDVDFCHNLPKIESNKESKSMLDRWF